MSASTVSITPSPTTRSRRRALEKKGVDPFNDNDAVMAVPPSRTTAQNAATPAAGDGTNRIRVETAMASHRDRDPVLRTVLPDATATAATNNRRATNLGRKAAKPEKPKWLAVGRILTKNFLLLLVLVGLVQMVRKLVDKNTYFMTSDGIQVISSDWEGKFAEMDSFVKKTTKMIQVQVDVIDRKLARHIGTVKEHLESRDVKIDKKLSEIQENLVKELGERSKKLLSKEEFEAFLEEYMKVKGKQRGTDGGVSLDEVRDYAREIVQREIEKHAADGLGRVDYAVASGGAMVVEHSEPYNAGRAGGSWLTGRSVHPDAEKMLTPSFGEPGKCFPLKGSAGFVIILLRTAIVPEAVTLEHVAESVAYDRSSAPNDCRVSGWLQDKDNTAAESESESMFLLTEFTYDLEKSNAQTFNVLDSVGSNVVDTIRFDFTSNHGSSSLTCIYRLRIHGHEPS